MARVPADGAYKGLSLQISNALTVLREVTFTVSPDDDPVVTFLREHPDSTHTSYSISVSGDVAWQVNVFHGDPEAVKRYVRDVIPDPGPLKVEATVFSSGREEVAYFLTWRRPRRGRAVSVPHLVLDALGPGFMLYSETNTEGRNYRLYVTPTMNLRPLHKALRDGLGTSVRVDAVRESGLPGRGAELTELQEKVLRTAVDEGYYEIPHRLGLAGLAKRLKIPVSTVSYNLRRAEAAILEERHKQRYPGRRRRRT
jgi:hypothetical protein